MKWIIRIDRTNYELDDRADLQGQVVERRVRPNIPFSIATPENLMNLKLARRNGKLGLDLYMSLGAGAVSGCIALRRAARVGSAQSLCKRLQELPCDAAVPFD
jgi:hypothetical protein